MFWFAHAPSNVALIKYMGKKDATKNIPDNPSLSYTLEELFTTVQLEHNPGKEDYWEPLNTPGSLQFTLPLSGQKRFLEHLAWIKMHFQYPGGFVVRSTNNFPTSSGLASSASSFAALTKCAVTAICELTKRSLPTVLEQAQLSRQGSGSSCRSFYAPWALWQNDTVEAVEFPYTTLLHQVVIVSHDEKKVSSSEAHNRVKTSPFYAGRPERAETNLRLLVDAFNTKDWALAHTICWDEFQDMHKLFETAEQPFTYRNENSLEVLRSVQAFAEKKGDAPLVTMDAGPNIHLLYRQDQAELARVFKQDYLISNYDIL
jgi:diphosphomevalonate decarboxylase